MFVATMLASNIRRRLSSWKNSPEEDADELQPLNRNHDYPELMNVFSGIRIERRAGEKQAHLLNDGGKARRLLEALGLALNLDGGLFCNLLLCPPRKAVDECRALGLL